MFARVSKFFSDYKDSDVSVLHLYFSANGPIEIYEYIDCLTIRTACLVCFISTVNGRCNKKRKEKRKLTLGRPVLVAGTQETLSILF